MAEQLAEQIKVTFKKDHGDSCSVQAVMVFFAELIVAAAYWNMDYIGATTMVVALAMIRASMTVVVLTTIGASTTVGR